MKKTFLYFAALLSIVFVSCKKEKTTACSNTMASIAGTYSFVKFEAGIGGVFQDVTTDQLDPCQLDDKIVLNVNGTTSYMDLGTKCDPSGDDTGTWNISSTGQITIDDNTVEASSADITSFDCSTLVITATEPSSGFKYRVTMKK